MNFIKKLESNDMIIEDNDEPNNSADGITADIVDKLERNSGIALYTDPATTDGKTILKENSLTLWTSQSLTSLNLNFDHTNGVDAAVYSLRFNLPSFFCIKRIVLPSLSFKSAFPSAVNFLVISELFSNCFGNT